MSDNLKQGTLFEMKKETQTGPVTCLGLTFENDDARRAYFTEELSKKLPELKKIEGFPVGEDEDILALSDPPYYTACPNPFISDFIFQWNKERDYQSEENDKYYCEPFATDVSEGKYDPLYKMHPYHTKVPHRAIMRYILHYTKPGDIVFDGFCGTGMTGVAAQLCGDKDSVTSLGYKVLENGSILRQEVNDQGELDWVEFSRLGERRAVLNDLSPAATFIANNYNMPDDVISYETKAKKILSEVEKECKWMYETKHTDGSIGYIQYVIWSDVFTCPECTEEIIFWETAVDIPGGKVLEDFNCPNCNSLLKKRLLNRKIENVYDNYLKRVDTISKQVPVVISYSVGSQRYEKKPDDIDIDNIRKIELMDIPNWYPTNELPDGVNTVQPKRSHGITNVHQFYTKRNLAVLASFYSKADRKKLNTLTTVALRITKRYGLTYQAGVWGAGGGPTNGTYYIPALVKELNMLNMLEAAIKKQADGKQNIKWHYNNAIITTQSLKNIKSESGVFDYIFIDPPFGSNLNYSELNFMWESWLKVWTNNESEAIENKVQNKGIDDYRQIMTSCFKEAYRLLKPGRWITIEFSNTSASVWNNIQTALFDAGFIVSNVSVLDKQKGSFKAQTTPTAVKQDLVITAYKPTNEMQTEIRRTQNEDESAWVFISNHLEHLPISIGDNSSIDLVVERTPRVLFDRMVAYHVQNGFVVPVSSSDFQAEIARRYPMRDGMVFLEAQVAEYDKKRIKGREFIQMSLFVSDESSAIEWLRQQLLIKPQTRQEIHPGYMKEIQHISKHELLPELDVLLEQNFLKYEGTGSVPSQIHTYLSTNFKDLRDLDKQNVALRQKAKDRWYVPDPSKQSDLEKLREKSLLREFGSYIEEIINSKKKLKKFRTEAIRAGFKKAWGEKDYQTIVTIGDRLPENVLQEDDKLLMYYDNAQIRLGL